MPDAPIDFAPPQSANFLLELEARQDELIRQLDDLNARVEQAITAGQLHVRSESAPAVQAASLQTADRQ